MGTVATRSKTWIRTLSGDGVFLVIHEYNFLHHALFFHCNYPAFSQALPKAIEARAWTNLAPGAALPDNLEAEAAELSQLLARSKVAMDEARAKAEAAAQGATAARDARPTLALSDLAPPPGLALVAAHGGDEAGPSSPARLPASTGRATHSMDAANKAKQIQALAAVSICLNLS